MKVVSVLGCGWVGKVLRDVLSSEYKVHCLVRDMKENEKDGLYVCDIFIIAIPPKDDYLYVLSKTLDKLKPSTQVILLSSVSFYDGKFLVLEAESLVTKLHKRNVILRLGGLMGYDRIAGKYTAGKTLAHNSRTNYVHRDDVIGIIKSVIKKNIVNEIFDVVAPQQSTKKDIFYTNAKKFGFKETFFLPSCKVAKMLSFRKVCEVLKYNFLKEDVARFWD